MNLSHSDKLSETSYIEPFLPVSVFVQSLQPSVCIFHLPQYKFFSVSGAPINVVINKDVVASELYALQRIFIQVFKAVVVFIMNLWNRHKEL